MPTSLRLFAAAEVPEGHRRAVARALDAARSKMPAGRWLPVENQHVTLKFLGATAEDDVPGIIEACREVAAAHAPATVRLEELGAFPSLRRARVLWAGLDDPDGLLRSLARGLDAACEPFGFVPEKRAFTPHLTLARFKAPGSVERSLPDVDWSTLEPFEVDGIVLFRSHLSPKGARYEPIAELPLG